MSDSVKKNNENISCRNLKNSDDCNTNYKTDKKTEKNHLKVERMENTNKTNEIKLKNLSIVENHIHKETATDVSSKISENTKYGDELACVEQNYSNRLESLQQQLKLKMDTDFLLDFSKYDKTKSLS